jgi:hypothetical protein
MTESEVQEFVTRFAAAWAARDGDMFAALWHGDGVLHQDRVHRQRAATRGPRRPPGPGYAKR